MRPTLYLASASPRRRQLLAEAGIAFVPHVVPVDEDALTAAYSSPLERLGEHLARQKALAARRDLREHGEDGIVLASDTTVLADGRSLAKPKNTREAIAMLAALRGREHVVVTGVAVAEPGSDEIRSASSRSRVRMRGYSDEEVRAYVASGDPLDKAGAYSIQHAGFHPVASFSGCYLGIVGLPVCIVAALLGRGSLPPLQTVLPRSAGSNQRCVWSSRCVLPYPGHDSLEINHDDASDS